MKLEIKDLNFFLPEDLLQVYSEKVKYLSQKLEIIAKGAGTGNYRFRDLYNKMYKDIEFGKNPEEILFSKIYLRAFALIIQSDIKKNIHITNVLIQKIQKLTSRPSFLLIEAMYQHFLDEYDRIEELDGLIKWLIKSREVRKINKWHDSDIISSEGPKWLARRQ